MPSSGLAFDFAPRAVQTLRAAAGRYAYLGIGLRAYDHVSVTNKRPGVRLSPQSQDPRVITFLQQEALRCILTLVSPAAS